MKICPKCHKRSLRVESSNSELIGDTLHIIRSYQCLNPDCSHHFDTTERVTNGYPKRIPNNLKKYYDR